MAVGTGPRCAKGTSLTSRFTQFGILVGAAFGLLGSCSSTHGRHATDAARTSPCEEQPQPRLRLEPVLESASALKVAQQGLLGMAPWRDQGLVLFVLGVTNRVWMVDSLGNSTPVPIPDSVWATFPDISRLLSTPSGHLVLWEGVTGTAVVVKPDGQISSIHQLAQPRTGSPAAVIGPDGDLYLELDRKGGAQLIIRARWPLGSAIPDTFVMPATGEGRKFAIAREGALLIRQRVPFHPEPVWGALAGGVVGWSPGAQRVVYGVSGASRRLLICDPGYPRAPITQAEREENEAIITWANRSTDPNWEYEGPRVPEVHPAIVGIGSDWAGRTLVTVPRESRSISAAEAWSMNPADSTAPLRHFEHAYDVHVYSPDTKPLGVFTLPPRVQPEFAIVTGEGVWGFEIDMRTGGAELIRYRVVAE